MTRKNPCPGCGRLKSQYYPLCNRCDKIEDAYYIDGEGKVQVLPRAVEEELGAEAEKGQLLPLDCPIP